MQGGLLASTFNNSSTQLSSYISQATCPLPCTVQPRCTYAVHCPHFIYTSHSFLSENISQQIDVAYYRSLYSLFHLLYIIVYLIFLVYYYFLFYSNIHMLHCNYRCVGSTNNIPAKPIPCKKLRGSLWQHRTALYSSPVGIKSLLAF